MSQTPETPHASAKRPKPWHAWSQHLKKLRRSRGQVEAEPDQPVVEEEDLAQAREAAEHEQHEKEVEKSLAAIYSANGRSADLSLLERRRSWHGLYALLAVLTVAAAGYAVVYWAPPWLKPWQRPAKSQLELTIQGPSDVTLGQEELFTVGWSNPGFEPLQQVELHLSFPQEFQLTAVEPASSASGTLRFTLDEVASGQRGTLTVKGIFLGALGSQSAVQALATFQQTSGERGQAVATQPVAFTQSALYGNLILPPKIMVGDPVALRYLVTNRGTQTLRDLKARLLLPAGFLLTANASSSIPGTSVSGKSVEPEREARFDLPELPPGGYATVQLQGSFTAGLSGTNLLRAETGWPGADGQFVVLQRVEAPLPVVAGDLRLQLVVNGSDADQALEAGSPLRWAIGYGNASPETLKNIKLRLSFESSVNGRSAAGTSLLDWKRLDDPQAGVSSTKPRVQTLEYGAAQIPALANLPAGAQDVLEGALPALPSPSGTRDAWIRLTLEGRIEKVGDATVNRVVYTQPLVLRYRSGAALEAEARYFTEEGAPVGSGSLPPVAGKATTYRIFWRVSKKMHALNKVTVTAVLPKGVDWSNNASADQGEISFDETARLVRWSLPALAENLAEAGATFDLKLTPAPLDVGRFAALLGETRLEAHDAALDQALACTQPALSTDLQNDEGAAGKGVVREK